MTGLELLWEVDLRMHHQGHWVATGVFSGARWAAPQGTFDILTCGFVGLVASGPSADEAKANLKAWARLKTTRSAAA